MVHITKRNSAAGRKTHPEISKKMQSTADFSKRRNSN